MSVSIDHVYVPFM